MDSMFDTTMVWSARDLAERWRCTEDEADDVIEAFGRTEYMLASGQPLLGDCDLEWIERHTRQERAEGRFADAALRVMEGHAEELREVLRIGERVAV